MKTKTGYTFVELIISMVILFLAVMVIGSIFPASFKSLLKSKQVTIATTLAQQKLEQCLINPKDYETRVGKEGTFSPDHPEYSYSITEKQVTDKLKEIKVEVSKLVNGSKIIDAAVAQLVTKTQQPCWEVRFKFLNKISPPAPSEFLTSDVVPTLQSAQGGLFLKGLDGWWKIYSATVKNTTSSNINVKVQYCLIGMGFDVLINGNYKLREADLYYNGNPWRNTGTVTFAPGTNFIQVVVYQNHLWNTTPIVTALSFPVFQTQGIEFVSAP